MTAVRADRGSATVAFVVVMFASTSLAVVWLARDVDRTVSDRAAAQSIAFQAARSAAHAVDVPRMRSGDVEGVPLDPRGAAVAARATTARLAAAFDIDHVVTGVRVEGDVITVVVEVHDGGRVVTGTGRVRAEERG